MSSRLIDPKMFWPKTKNPASGLPLRGSGFAIPSDFVESEPHPNPYRSAEPYPEPEQLRAQNLTDIDDANGAGERHGAKV